DLGARLPRDGRALPKPRDAADLRAGIGRRLPGPHREGAEAAARAAGGGRARPRGPGWRVRKLAAHLPDLPEGQRRGREVLQIMRRETLKRISRIVVVTALVAAPIGYAQAQPMAGGASGGRMPDLSQIVGRPLPDRGMPTGT